MAGRLPPHIRTAVPGPRSVEQVHALAQTECPAFTARRASRASASGANWHPIVWSEADGCNVVDADGNIYVDLTSGFGVAALGHRHPRVQAALRQQLDRLVVGLGDVYPSDTKIALLDRLTQLAPWPKARALLSVTGSDAIETALKTAMLATGRAHVVAFEGAYHGLAHGPLALCGYSAAFRAPFAGQLHGHVTFLSYPDGLRADLDQAREILAREWPNEPVGAVFVEPIVGRGGVVVPPAGFLGALQAKCKASGALLVADEILTGLGRTGSWLRCQSESVTPDIVCLGKGLGGGLPLSACLAEASVMETWAGKGQEALHAGTFFGHPLACAGALATLEVIETERLCERARELGTHLLGRLRALAAREPKIAAVRGDGLLVGIELGENVLGTVARLRTAGFLTLPAHRDARVVQLLPPLTIGIDLLDAFVEALESILRRSS